MEQALPLQPDWLNFNRFALRAEKTLPLGPFRWVPARRKALPAAACLQFCLFL
jgi:hypothetical protein